MRLTSLLLLLAAGGCSAWQPPPVEPYWSGDLETAESIFRERQERAGGDWILMTNELATILDAQGRATESWQLFYEAGRAMAIWDSSFGDSFGTIVGREDTRDYKGDPYEQAFNSIYTGLLFRERGEADNARACFKEAMLRDADSTEDRFKSDLALSFYLAAWASRDMGVVGAEDFLDEARVARETAVTNGARGAATPTCLDGLGEGNLLVVASIGRGPIKVAGGPYGSVAVIEPGESFLTGAALTLDGQSLGRTEILADVFYQASTRGGRWMDGVRGGKAVFKDMARKTGAVLTTVGLAKESHKHRAGLIIAGIGALLLSAAVSAEADVRCWRTLPDTVQVLARRASPGRHRLAIEFLDTGGRAVSGYRQEMDVDVPAWGTVVLHLRSLPARQAVAAALSPSRSETKEEQR